jgi:enoyl-CoA hydratase/carnithine racemase
MVRNPNGARGVVPSATPHQEDQVQDAGSGLVAEVRGGVGRLLLDRPERRNALSRPLVLELERVLATWAVDRSVRAVVVTGAGGQFCSGADLKDRIGMTGDERYAHSRLIQRVLQDLARFPMPTIAAIDGYCLGGGAELALACDLRLASDRAVLGFPEVRLGVFPAAGGSQRLPAVVGPAVAAELIFTGRHVPAAEAHGLGLVNRVVPAGELGAAADELAATLASRAPLALKMAKRALELATSGHLGAGLEYESAAAKVVLGSADYAEGLAAFAERREPRFEGR